jgi:hypothetical protein
MVALSDRKIEIVRTLVESAPDQIVGGLRMALMEAAGDSVLASVRQLVEAETEDRLLRNTIFEAIAPLCIGDGSNRQRLVFPAQALALLWRGLKIQDSPQMTGALSAAAAVAGALAAEQHQRVPDPTRPYDLLVKAAVSAMRDGELREFRAAAELCDRARPGGAEAFIACLELSPIVRRVLPRLPEWIAHASEEVTAHARIAYKDAVRVSEDAGPRFFEMLAAHLDPPWMVLRVISAVMDKPAERYLAASELGGFAERILADIDESLRAIGKLDLDGGPDAGRAAARLVELVTRQAFELEVSIDLSRNQGWGQRLTNQKKGLASLVEGRLRDFDKFTAAALPMRPTGFGRSRKAAPISDAPPDPGVGRRVKTLLGFVTEVHACVDNGGFSATYAKVTDKVVERVDQYVEEVMDLIRTGDVSELQNAHAFLRIAADIVGPMRDERTADFIRRRAATACAPPQNSADTPGLRPIVLDA